jgi:hypothetical protein
MTWRWVSAATLGSCLAWLAIARGCTDMSGNSAPGSDTGQGATDVTAKQEASTETESGRCGDTQRPATVPAGWEYFPDYSCVCGLYYAPTADLLPPPIQWRDCDGTATPPGAICRQMTEDWNADASGIGISPWVRGYVRGDGHVILQVSRVDASLIYRLLGDADGPITQAILEASPSCTLGQSSVAAGFYEYTLTGASSPGPGAVLAGAVSGLRPSLFLQYEPVGNVMPYYVVGVSGVLEETQSDLVLYAWSQPMAPMSIGAAAQDPGLVFSNPAFAGSQLVWTAQSSTTSKLKFYAPGTGVQDLVGFAAGASSGAADVGYDGQELAWLEGDQETEAGSYASVSVMTASFSGNVSSLAPRRLRSESPAYFGLSPYVVGCGYAVRLTEQGGAWGDLLVRLSDGQAWFLTGGPAAGWAWSDPVAVTCTELFAVVAPQQGGRSIARVALASLGQGIAP